MDNVLHLFTTPLGITDMRKPTQSEMDFIVNAEKRDNFKNKSSIETYILERPELSNLKKELEAQLHDFFNEVYRPQDGASIKITQSWTNYSESDQSHHKHSHGNSVISGVYYPLSENEGDLIEFYSPMSSFQRLELISLEANSSTSHRFYVQSQSGRLLLFPSHIEHSVPNIGNRGSTRISLAFNTFYTGSIGSAESLTELKLSD